MADIKLNHDNNETKILKLFFFIRLLEIHGFNVPSLSLAGASNLTF